MHPLWDLWFSEFRKNRFDDFNKSIKSIKSQKIAKSINKLVNGSGSFQAGIGKPGTQNPDLARSEKEALFRAGIQE